LVARRRLGRHGGPEALELPLAVFGLRRRTVHTTVKRRP
jgi:hypothetical protein